MGEVLTLWHGYRANSVNRPPLEVVIPGRTPLPGAKPCPPPANIAPTPPWAPLASKTCPGPRSPARVATTAGGAARAADIAPIATAWHAAPSTTWATPSPDDPATSS